MGNKLIKNTPELWDKTWNPRSAKEDKFFVKEEECSIRWQEIEKEIKERFGSFKGLEVIELGCGSAKNSCLFAQRGANIVVVDSSPEAIERATTLLRRHKVGVITINQDAITASCNYREQFDVAMSFGLVEHFKGIERENIINAHFRLVRPGGLVIISVPHKGDITYFAFRKIAELKGVWRVGEEYPFSRRELKRLCKIHSIKHKLIGTSLRSTFHWMMPWNWNIIKKITGYKEIKDLKDIKLLKKEKRTLLDKYIGSGITIFAYNDKYNENGEYNDGMDTPEGIIVMLFVYFIMFLILLGLYTLMKWLL